MSNTSGYAISGNHMSGFGVNQVLHDSKVFCVGLPRRPRGFRLSIGAFEQRGGSSCASATISCGMPIAVTSSDATSLAFFVVFLLLAVGAVASPFNAYLRFKYFSDGYCWRGFNRQDSIPLSKTLALSVAFSAGAVYEGLAFLRKTGVLSNVLVGILAAGIVATVGFSIWHSLWRARRAKKSRHEERTRD